MVKVSCTLVLTLRNLEFVDDQKRHRQNQLQSMSSAHNKIAELMAVIYETFAEDGPEVSTLTRRCLLQLQVNTCSLNVQCVFVVLQVQHYWEIYTKKVDHLVQEALRSNIKNSMKKLSKAINGDNKTTPNPLFQVLVVLRESSPNVTPKVPLTMSCVSYLMTNSVGIRVCVCLCPLAGGFLAAPPEAGSNGGHSASAH